MSETDLHSPPAASTQVIDGRYRLLRLIGIGGMGAVYEAEHVAIGRRVALKILHPQFSQHADLVERLRREAQAASRIGHPNIVDVTDFGRTEDASAYLVMEFLVGTDLGAILRERGCLNETRALRIGLQTAQALGAAHRVSIVHRDLKPENIFIVNPVDWPIDRFGGPAVSDRSGLRQIPRSGSALTGNGPPSSPTNTGGAMDLVKVLDFGVAVQLGSTSTPLAEPVVTLHPSLQATRLTNPGLTVGTPEYMAPEQATGTGVDARADIYAVGTLLFEMVCGRVPFVSPQVPELLTMKIGQPAPSPRIFAQGISAGLEALILRCLERDPDARPQTMEEIEEALLDIATGAAHLPEPAPTGPIQLAPASTLREGGDPSPSKPSATPSDSAAAMSGDLIGRIAIPASSTLTPAAAASGELSTSGTSGVPLTAPSRWSTRIGLAAVVVGSAALIIVGFASARYFARRTAPIGLGSGPATVASTAPVPVLKAAPPSEPAAGAQAPRPAMAVAPALTPLPTSPPAAPAVPDEPGGDVQMLLEWARRAASGRRYTEPPGDNLMELLARIEAKSEKGEARALRDEVVRTLNQELRDQLRHHHGLEALESYRALRAIDPERPLPRRELVFQLLFMARTGQKGRETTLQAAHGAVEVMPSNAAAHLALADADFSTGKKESAASEYRRVLELRPRPTERRLAEQGLARLGKPVPQLKHAPPKHR